MIVGRTTIPCAMETTGMSMLGADKAPISTLGEIARAIFKRTDSTNHLAGKFFTLLNSCPVRTCTHQAVRLGDSS